MSKKKVLLVGESWISSATHYKGFDQFGSVTFHLGAEPLVKAGAAIVFNKVSFAYPGGMQVFDKFSLRIQPGRRPRRNGAFRDRPQMRRG